MLKRFPRGVDRETVEGESLHEDGFEKGRGDGAAIVAVLV